MKPKLLFGFFCGVWFEVPQLAIVAYALLVVNIVKSSTFDFSATENRMQLFYCCKSLLCDGYFN